MRMVGFAITTSNIECRKSWKHYKKCKRAALSLH